MIKWIITTSGVLMPSYPSMSNSLMLFLKRRKRHPRINYQQYGDTITVFVHAHLMSPYCRSSCDVSPSDPVSLLPFERANMDFPFKLQSASLSQCNSWGARASCFFSHLLCCLCCSLAPFPRSTERGGDKLALTLQDPHHMEPRLLIYSCGKTRAV